MGSDTQPQQISAPDQHVTEAHRRVEQGVVSRLREVGRSLACAESLTGGRLAATVVDVPGASAVFRGGAVTYATDTKATVLDVPVQLLTDRGPVDPEVAVAMASGAATLFGTGSRCGHHRGGGAGSAGRESRSAPSSPRSSTRSVACQLSGEHR